MKRLLGALALALLLQAPLTAAGLSSTAETRPLLPAAWNGLLQYGSAPSRWDEQDLRWAMATAMGAGLLWSLDVDLHQRLSRGDARKEWLDASMPIVSHAGEGWAELSAVLVAYGLGNERLRKTSGAALEALAIAGAYTEVFKAAAWSNRPSQDASSHRLWAYDQSSRGMPSGHSFSAFALAEVYGAEYGRMLPYGLACLMGYSRLYTQAHWPSDVLVGAVLGIAAGHIAREDSLAHGAPSFRFSLKPADGGTPLLAAQLGF